MALTGTDIGLTVEYMTDLAQGAEALSRYSAGQDANVDEATDIAADEFRSAAIKGGYAEADIDALTDETIPARWQRLIGHIALEELSSGGIGRPAIIKEKADQARKTLSYLAGGAETIVGLTKVENGAGAVSSSSRSDRPRVFRRPNTDETCNTDFNYRDEPI